MSSYTQNLGISYVYRLGVNIYQLVHIVVVSFLTFMPDYNWNPIHDIDWIVIEKGILLVL